MKRLLIPICLLLLISCSNNKVNLVSNPSFESGEGTEPAPWVKLVTKDVLSYDMGIVKDEFHSGTSSYRISRVWCTTWQQAGIKSAELLPIDPQKKYILSFWYKTRDITEYPLALVCRFKVKSENTPEVTYRKSIHNSDNWQQYFILLDNIPFDAKQLDLGFYCWMRTKGSIWIDDIEFREASSKDIRSFEAWRRQETPSPAGDATKASFASTGFYRVDKAADRWWFVDPDGKPAWALATVGEVPDIKSAPAQNEVFRKTYGTNREDVVKATYDMLQNVCGFNWFAGWTSRDLANETARRSDAGQKYMPYTHVMNLSNAGELASAYARDREGKLLNTSGHWVVDPFNPEWRKMAAQKAAELIEPVRGKKWFAGWYIDNEMDYDDLYRYVWADYSSQELIKMLKGKYGKIEDLNKAWTSSFGTYTYKKFEDILTDKPEPKDWDDPLWPDFTAFERIMMAEYINFTYDLVKGLDPDHIVISNRLHLGPMPSLYRTIDLWGKYDLVCMNIYPDNNIIGFNPGELEIMKKLHEGTKKPVIIGEWSVPAIDSKLYEFGVDSLNRPLDWSWPQVTRTQKERAEVYRMCMMQLASMDFMLGAGWFKTNDVNSNVRRANRGLWNGNYELYRDLTDEMRRTNGEISEKFEIK